MLDSMQLSDFPIHVRMFVVWGQMDVFGHLNNIVYFCFFEDARIACFEVIGLNEYMVQYGEGFILVKIFCVYRQTITFPDKVFSATRIRDLGDTKLSLLCVGEFPGFVGFKGLGELDPQQMASLLGARHEVASAETALAAAAWAAFCSPDPTDLERLLRGDTTALPYLGEALLRWDEAAGRLARR